MATRTVSEQRLPPLERPRDFNQLAKRVVDIGTGQVADLPVPLPSQKARGGHARAAALTPEQRRAIARKAAAARWPQPTA